MGYASIINLRLATEQGRHRRNTAAAKVAGIPYYHIPFSGSAPDPAVVDTFLRRSPRRASNPRSSIERAVEEPPGWAHETHDRRWLGHGQGS
jgi:hypothetical protein